MLNKKVGGAYTALITPFLEDGIDFASLEAFVDYQVEQGIKGLVPAGSTGESMSFTKNEHYEVIKTTVDVVAGRVPVIAGIGSNSTEFAIELGMNAKRAGADIIMAVMPYYNRPPADGLIQHFNKISEKVDLPLLLYNVPSRTSSDLDLDLIKKLAENPNIIGIKDASGDLSRVKSYKNLRGDHFTQMSGEDALMHEYMTLGGDGVISVISNILPGLWSDLCSSKKSFYMTDVWQLLQALSCCVNPIPIKYAVNRMGFAKEIYRLPLVPLDPKQKKLIDEQMEKLNLI